MVGSGGEWIEILEVGTMRLWDDNPPAATMTLATTAAEFGSLVRSLSVDALAESSMYGGLDAEISSADGRTRALMVYRMIITPGTAPAKLHTGNGIGDWIRPSNSIRIVGLAGGEGTAPYTTGN